jgi:hypothetical protein
MKKWFVIAFCLALSACARNRSDVSYVPNSNVSEPAKVIERVIRHQPPAYTTVPHEVVVKSDCIEFRTTYQPGLWVLKNTPGELTNSICYKNIGKVVLYKNDIWYVEILDRSGYWMYYVYSFDESEAKLFIDALYSVMGK